MKENVSCEMIQDLLPNYINNIVSEKTKSLVSEHLNECDSWKKESKKFINYLYCALCCVFFAFCLFY